MGGYVRSGLYLGASCAGIATLLSLLPMQWWWGFELLSHPRPQYTLMLLLALIMLLIDKTWWAISLLALPLLINLTYLIPWYIPLTTQATTKQSAVITITHLNLDKHADNHDRAVAYLRQTQAQLLLLQELTPALAARVAIDLPDYQTVIAKPLDNTHGSAILIHKQAKLNIFSKRVIYLPTHASRPLLEIGIKIGKHTLWLLSLHTTRVTDQNNLAWQGVEFEAAAAWSAAYLEANHHHSLIIGDFNSTPWSRHFQQITLQGQLSTQAAGHFPT